MKMKKLLALALAGVMTVAMFAGCTSSDNGGSTAGNDGGNTTQQDGGNSSGGGSDSGSGSGDVVTINVTKATFNLAQADSDQVKKIENAINEYIKDKINVQITLTDIGSGEYTDKVNLALNNNELNLFWTASWEGTIGTNDLVPINAVYDITDLLQSEDGKTLYGSMDAGQWEATKYDGKNFFIPVYKDNVEGYDIMVRKALVDKYNWDLNSISKLADIEPMLADCKAEGLKYPYLTQKTAMFYRWYIDSFDFFTADSASNWVAVDRSKNEVVDTILTDEYLEFCTLMAEWAEKGYISEDDVTKTTTDTTTQTQDWGFSWWTDVPVNDQASGRYGQDVILVSATDRWAHSTSALGSCYAIAANSSEEQAKACLRFMGLLYTDKTLADMYVFGIEGEDFHYDNGHAVKDGDKINNDMWHCASATVVSPTDSEPDNFADLYKAFNGGAKTSCAAGFRFNKEPVAAQMSACAGVFDQYGFALENGGIPVADVQKTIEAYQAALDEAGYQEILAEFQRQYDAWK